MLACSGELKIAFREMHLSPRRYREESGKDANRQRVNSSLLQFFHRQADRGNTVGTQLHIAFLECGIPAVVGIQSYRHIIPVELGGHNIIDVCVS